MASCSHYVTVTGGHHRCGGRAATRRNFYASLGSERQRVNGSTHELTRWHNLICLRTPIHSTCSPAAWCFSTRPFNHSLVRILIKGVSRRSPDPCHPADRKAAHSILGFIRSLRAIQEIAAARGGVVSVATVHPSDDKCIAPIAQFFVSCAKLSAARQCRADVATPDCLLTLSYATPRQLQPLRNQGVRPQMKIIRTNRMRAASAFHPTLPTQKHVRCQSGVKTFAIVGAGVTDSFVVHQFLKDKAAGTVNKAVVLTRQVSLVGLTLVRIPLAQQLWQGLKATIGGDAKVIPVDYSDKESIKRALSGIDVVVSAIAQAALGL